MAVSPAPAQAPWPAGLDRLPVLVLDGDQASALAVVRALARRGLTVEVAASVQRPLAGCSRHARATLRYPDPLREGEAFVAWMQQQLASGRHGLVIPVTERTVVPLLRQRERLDDRRLAIAPSAALEQVLDKSRTLALAQSLGLEIPRSVPVDSVDAALAAAQDLGYPVVVKPSRSVGQGSGESGQAERVQLSVSYAHGERELRAQVQHALRFGGVLLQEFFRGDGVGIELIADRGRVAYAFQHRRLHEVPLTGGGSSLRVSEPIVPVLRQAAEALMQALQWHGVAMVEFKWQPATGQYRLMEINGRFWGSLPLAVAAGADFPGLLHALYTQGRVPPLAPARDGVYARQLARDLDWLEHVLRKAAPPALVSLPGPGQVLRDSLLVCSPRHHFDVQSWRDPWPGLVDLGRIAQRQWQRVTEQWQLRRARAGARRDGRRRAAAGAQGQVLFLCHGNINRSALAQARAQQRAPAGCRFSSAGFHQPGGRPADPSMVAAAAARGVDLSVWSSTALSAQQVAQADLILAMELAHLDKLLAAHPAARGKAFLLGAAAAEGTVPLEIADPYGQSPAVYERVCAQVLAAVDAWWPATGATSTSTTSTGTGTSTSATTAAAGAAPVRR